jgi:hypothetical protein
MTIEDTDRAEQKAYRPGVNRSSGPKNRKSQLLLALALAATFVGASLALAARGTLGLIGLCLLVVGLPTLVITAVWCFRNWDY